MGGGDTPTKSWFLIEKSMRIITRPIITSCCIPMRSLEDLNFINTYAELFDELYTALEPQPLSNPHLVSASASAAALIDLDPQQLENPALVAYFSGQKQLPGSDPLAMVYAGHQFGGYSPQLGDGRGLLLGEVHSSKGKWDLHLKGAGPTPYSRFGDGRAVLRSSIREYLCSEAMAGLGIATTRGLCVIASDTAVQRETVEKGATLLRLARSHIRFGHFEYCHYTGRPDLVKKLADYVIEHHYPEAHQHDNPYAYLLSAVVKSTALMIANWQGVGFAHGVMNTDNMSIVGDTFDYGPFAFIDDFDPGFICNHSDHHGRYAFDRQPSIGLWNLNALAHAFSSLLDEKQLRQILAEYEPTLVEHFYQLMNAKLGLTGRQEGDQELVRDWLTLMYNNRMDYTLSFRKLAAITDPAGLASLRNDVIDRSVFDPWIQRYRQRLEQEAATNESRQQQMNACNPKYVLRNYLAQQAIERAEKGNYDEVNRLLSVLRNPFDEQSDHENYAKAPPEWGKQLEISCSS